MNPARIDTITKLLNEAWSRVPDMHFMQLINEMDPRAIGAPHQYTDDMLQTAIHGVIAKLDRQDLEDDGLRKRVAGRNSS